METFVKTFRDSYALFEASTLSKTGMPKSMISAIHQKEEHRSDKYQKLAHVKRGKAPLTMQYKYFVPSHEIEVSSPLLFTGRKVADPKGLRKSEYPDLAQFLIDLPMGPIRVLIASADNDFWLYLYHKSPRQNGEQYAVIIWDKDKKIAEDYGFVGVTTEGVEKKLVRDVHHDKGGNRNDKIQELIFQLTGGPSRSNPISVYEFDIDVEKEPRVKREKRAPLSEQETPSLTFIDNFANTYADLFAKLGSKAKTAIGGKAISSSHYDAALTEQASKMPGIQKMAKAVDMPESKVLSSLFNTFTIFRSESFDKAATNKDELRGLYKPTDG